MVPSRLWLGVVPVSAILVSIASCSGREPVRIALDMRVTQGLLDDATSVSLFVFDSSLATCDGATGHLSAIPPAAQQFQLDHSGCSGGNSWCKTITLDRDDSTKLFGVQARSAAGIIAEGCTKATINQDPLSVDIKVSRYNPPSCCNDGTLQTGEQCEGTADAIACGTTGDPGGACLGITSDFVCDCACQANEILVTVSDMPKPRLPNGPAGSQTGLTMAFAPGSGAVGGSLRMLFVNRAPDNGGTPPLGGSDISEYFLQPDLYPITTPAPLQLQLQLPLICAQSQGPGLPSDQDAVAIAPAAADLMAIVYTSDDLVASRHDVYLNPQTLDGCMDAHACTKDTECQTQHCDNNRCRPQVLISTPANKAPGAQDPHVAMGPDGSVLVVWTRDSHVLGRIWKTDGSLTPSAGEIDFATGASHARVAGNAMGWKVVYQGSGGGDGDAVLIRGVGTDGSLQQEDRVNAVPDGPQDLPDVAMLEDGRTIVVWRSADDIYFQRYDANGMQVQGDQDNPLNTVTDGAQTNPAVAAAVGVGDFFTVAWETTDTTSISARFVGGSAGFLFNSVSGQNDEFLAGHPFFTSAIRSQPAVAIGRAGFVVIGWQDAEQDHSGIFVRRFPLPQTGSGG